MLSAEDFTDFYLQVNGEPPFPWQADLVGRVMSERAWPELIDVPTGLGKTALLDIAVFIGAATSEENGAGRLGRRRIFLVVDRRIVVDEAFDRATRLSGILDRSVTSGNDSVVRRVALGLQAFAPRAERALSIPAPVPVRQRPRSVLPVTRMRGGVTWDAAWLDRPDVPGIVVGTVDQVGSRLLFRGYGVSDRRKPIDAALAGIDSIILVDEAHLAEVMVTTVTDAHRRDTGGVDLPRADLVRMTATPGDTPMRRYSIDIEAHRGNEIAWRRLTAPKLLSVTTSDPKTIAQTMADHAVAMLSVERDTVLVVCNTVDRARQVHAVLQKATARRHDPLHAEITLLIGRSRPADRDQLVEQIKQRFGVGRRRVAGAVPAILVATQTVEVGANLDADGLVTESAPWDSLVQRLGRVNRLGDSPGTSPVVVVHDGVDDGPIYGRARDVTWEILQRDAGSGLDVSPLACRGFDGWLPPEVLAPRATPPLLTTPTLDCWTRTAPVPWPDTPVAPYLHGLGRAFATVSLAWREGLVDPDPTGDDAERPESDLNADLSAVSVRPEELVEVPLHAVRRWLRGESALSISDLDDDPDPGQRVKKVGDEFRALAWRSDQVVAAADGGQSASRATGSWYWIEASAVRPGDVLIVPTQRGGLDEYGWAPDSNVPVLDVSEVIRNRPAFPGTASGYGRPRWSPLLRIDEGTGRRLGMEPEDSRELRRLLRDLGNDDEDRERVSAQRALPVLLAAAIDRILPSAGNVPADERFASTVWTPAALSALKSWVVGPVTVAELLDSTGRGTGRFVLAPRGAEGSAVERDDEFPECSSMGLAQVSLSAHHSNVGDRARDIATDLRLPADVIVAVEAAARWHDLGKLDARFQAMLCGGDEFEAMLVDGPLAKSGIDPSDRDAYRLANRRSRLPLGARHEAWSAGLVRAYFNQSPAAGIGDNDLVVHLVASHHGHARPWLPAIQDDAPRELVALMYAPTEPAPGTKVSVDTGATVDFDHPARFARLNSFYGRWGLALLESIVRCADMTVSGEGS